MHPTHTRRQRARVSRPRKHQVFSCCPPIARDRTKPATRARHHFCAAQDSRTMPPKILYLCARDIQHFISFGQWRGALAISQIYVAAQFGQIIEIAIFLARFTEQANALPTELVDPHCQSGSEVAGKTGALVSVAGGISRLLKPGMERAPRDGPTAGPAPRRPSAGSDGRA
jgi:hypothetical protein